MNCWTLTIVGAAEETEITGEAADLAAATRDAVDALEAALIRHDGRGHRRYVLTVDDHPPAIVVTGRDHQHADPMNLIAAVRRSAAAR